MMVLAAMSMMTFNSCKNEEPEPTPTPEEAGTEAVLKFFKEVNAVPRPSMHEDKMRDYLKSFAAARNLRCAEDNGNIIIYKDATSGMAGAPMVCLQTHMDMVCAAAEEPNEPKQLPDIDSLKQLSNDQLFKFICRDIRDNRLFCDPNCDRQMLTQRYGLTAAQIGAAFAQGSEYASLSDFLRECRLEFACTLLTDTDAKVSEVATQSGFGRATTFNHDFKACYRLSPSEYRKQNKPS